MGYSVPSTAGIKKGIDFQQGETKITVQEIAAAPGFKLNPTEYVCVIKREKDELSIVSEKTTPEAELTVNGGTVTLVVQNEPLPPQLGGGGSGGGSGSNNGGQTPEWWKKHPYGVHITKVSKYNYNQHVPGAAFKITVKNSDGKILKTVNTGGTHRHYEEQLYCTTHAELGWDVGELTIEIEEIVPGYLHKLNTEKYVAVIERNERGQVVLNKDNQLQVLISV